MNFIKNKVVSNYAAAKGLKYYQSSEFANKSDIERRQEMLKKLTNTGFKSYEDYDSLKPRHIFTKCDKVTEQKKQLQNTLIEFFTEINGSEKLTDTQKELLNMVTMIGSQAIKGEEGKYEKARLSGMSGACVMYSKFTGKAYDKTIYGNINNMRNALKSIKTLIENKGNDAEGQKTAISSMFEGDDVESKKAIDVAACEAGEEQLDTVLNNIVQKAVSKGTQGGRKSKKARKGRKGRRTKNKRKRQTKKKRGKKRH